MLFLKIVLNRPEKSRRRLRSPQQNSNPLTKKQQPSSKKVVFDMRDVREVSFFTGRGDS